MNIIGINAYHGITLFSIVKKYQLGYVTDLVADSISLAIKKCLNYM